MLAITVTRQESLDPLSVIEQATRQAVAEQIAREHAHPTDGQALSFRYERDANSAGDYVDLVIEGSDETRVGLVLRRLRAHGYDDLSVEWLSDEDPPHLIQVYRSSDGAAAPASRAREALDELGHPDVVLVRGARYGEPNEGFYGTVIPATFPPRSVAALPDSDWIVQVIHRG
jgi:hypothetical protein